MALLARSAASKDAELVLRQEVAVLPAAEPKAGDGRQAGRGSPPWRGCSPGRCEGPAGDAGFAAVLA